MDRSEAPHTNKRKFLRVFSEVKGTYRKASPDLSEKWIPFETKTLGTGGLTFHSDRPLKPGDILEIRLFIGENPVEVESIILRIEQIQEVNSLKGVNGVALRFTKISSTERLRLNNHILPLLSEKLQS